MPPNRLCPPPKPIQKSPILNQKIKFRIRFLDLQQQQGIALVLLSCEVTMRPPVLWSFGDPWGACCNGAERGIGIGIRARPMAVHTQAALCTGLSTAFPPNAAWRGSAMGIVQIKARLALAGIGYPRTHLRGQRTPQNHCWECPRLTPTLFFLPFGPVHRHPREPASVHEPHPSTQPQEGLQPQRHVPVGAAEAHLCPYTSEG